jgi:hypothetical protein
VECNDAPEDEECASRPPLISSAVGFFCTIGLVTLTKVKHRRELLFAALPTLLLFTNLSRDSSGSVWMAYSRLPSPTSWERHLSCTHWAYFHFCCRSAGYFSSLL